jgi:hypothetical protein
MGQLAGISEDELKNLWIITYEQPPPYCTINHHGISCYRGFMVFI